MWRVLPRSNKYGAYIVSIFQKMQQVRGNFRLYIIEEKFAFMWDILYNNLKMCLVSPKRKERIP